MTHSSQPAPESTASLLAGYVHAAGVRHVFGYPGESVIDFMEAARRRGIRVVSAMREGTAAFMAEAAATAALSGFAARSRPLIVEARVDPAQYEAQF